MGNGSIDINKIPKKYLDELKEAGVKFSSDGKPRDLSARDISAAYEELEKKVPFFHTDKNPNAIKLRNVLLKIESFLTYLCDTDIHKALILENEIRKQSPQLGYRLRYITSASNNIEGREILYQRGIGLAIDSDNSDLSQLKFEIIKNGDLKITGRFDFSYIIPKAKLTALKEIIINNHEHPWSTGKVSGTIIERTLSVIYQDNIEDVLGNI